MHSCPKQSKVRHAHVGITPLKCILNVVVKGVYNTDSCDQHSKLLLTLMQHNLLSVHL